MEEFFRKKAFRYCNFWEEMEDYKSKVIICWNRSVRCRNLFMFQGKLKQMKQMMKQHFVPLTKGMDKRVDKARDELMTVQKQCEGLPNYEVLSREEAIKVKEFRKLKQYQMIFYKQRTKIQWMKEGDDANTQFFHSMLKSRQARNNISFVRKANGDTTTDKSVIKEEFISYFKSILGEKGTTAALRGV